MEEAKAHKVRGWGKLMLLVGELIGMGRRLAWGDCQSWSQRIGEATHPLTYAPND